MTLNIQTEAKRNSRTQFIAINVKNFICVVMMLSCVEYSPLADDTIKPLGTHIMKSVITYRFFDILGACITLLLSSIPTSFRHNPSLKPK